MQLAAARNAAALPNPTLESDAIRTGKVSVSSVVAQFPALSQDVASITHWPGTSAESSNRAVRCDPSKVVASDCHAPPLAGRIRI
jgi:hypothetical protein